MAVALPPRTTTSASDRVHPVSLRTVIDESTIYNIEDAPGYLGPLFDETPSATPGRIRPFIWAYLLLRGAVRRDEVVGALVAHVASDDLKVWDDPLDRTPLEALIDDELATLTMNGLLRVNGELYVLRPQGMAKAISLVCSLDAQLPDHLLQESALVAGR